MIRMARCMAGSSLVCVADVFKIAHEGNETRVSAKSQRAGQEVKASIIG